MCWTGSSAGISSTTPNRVRVCPSAFQNCGAVNSAVCAVLPAARRPPPRLRVAAVVDELPPFAVGDRDPADAERRHVDDVRGPFVVQRERLVGGVDAEDERSAGHQHRRAGQARPPGRQGAGLLQQRRPDAQVQCLQHGLVVLVLVADHQAEDEVVRPARRAARRARPARPLARSGSSCAPDPGDSSGRSTRLARECTKAS